MWTSSYQRLNSFSSWVSLQLLSTRRIPSAGLVAALNSPPFRLNTPTVTGWINGVPLSSSPLALALASRWAGMAFSTSSHSVS